MIPSQITQSVLALPEQERLELARLIVESIENRPQRACSVPDGVRRIEDIITGKVRGLSEADFRAVAAVVPTAMD